MNNNHKIPALVLGVTEKKEDYFKSLDSLEELSLLGDTAGYETVLKIIHNRRRIDPAYYIGEGKAREIKKLIAQRKVEAILLDFELTPVQLRNLENLLKSRVISRTELILNIFEKRAKTKEAKLQVELASLTYTLPRLRRMWTHLNRMDGMIGTRGPGEKQLEIDRRRALQRISRIKKQLEHVKTHREVIRKKRRSMNRVALVGYTNAGKSSLLNRLSHSALFTENRLFATLDPATREVWVGNGQKVLITDTVGFIRRLPHTLIASFRATLEEVRESELLLHVVDISRDDIVEKIEAVKDVLEEISADKLPVLYVFNKIDLLKSRNVKGSILSRFPDHVCVSAKTGEGIDDLKKALLNFFTPVKKANVLG